MGALGLPKGVSSSISLLSVMEGMLYNPLPPITAILVDVVVILGVQFYSKMNISHADYITVRDDDRMLDFNVIEQRAIAASQIL